ncbi:MAG: hypothetical protein ACFFKA_09500 [Candidatus Thorarchaeota archaeon]
MNEVAKLHEKNTLGIRLLNNLVNRYFIGGGKLDEQDVKDSSFQKSLTFKVEQ